MATNSDIIAYYEAILRETPSASQIQLGMGRVDAAATEEEGFEDLAASLLLQANDVRSVIRLYQAIFDRTPDDDGLTFWTDIFRDVQENNPGLSYKDALILSISDWLSSDEYEQNFGSDLSDGDFLSTLYLSILGRPSDQAGFDFWLARLQDPVDPITREQLVVEFTEAPEYKALVDDEANDLLQTAARIDSGSTADDINYEISGGDIYNGELANEAPTDILVSASVAEGAAEGTEVASMTPVDPDGEEAFTWSMVDASGNFALDGNKIVVAPGADIDFESDASFTVKITLTDKAGNDYVEDVTISVSDANEAPTNLQPAAADVDEEAANGTVVTALSVDDEDAGDSATFSIVSQSVAGAFAIVGGELVVADASAIDFDAGVTSVDVEVLATDAGGLTTSSTITVAINDLVDETPTDILTDNLNDNQSAETSATVAPSTVVATLSAVDADVNDSFTFTLDTDPSGAFVIDGDQLKLLDPTLVDSTSVPSGNVALTVTVTDAGGNSFTDTIEVTIDQSGQIIALTSQAVEVLQGGEGDDLFTAQAGLGEFGGFFPGQIPGLGETANGGDIVLGEGGEDTFVLIKDDNPESDGNSEVTGVILDRVENVVLSNRDDLLDVAENGFVPELTTTGIDTAALCTPCIDMPELGPDDAEALIFEVSLPSNTQLPDFADHIEQVRFVNSVNAMEIHDVQENFWNTDPMWVLDDITGAYFAFDSDPEAIEAGDDAALAITANEVLTNALWISQNAAENEPGGRTGEDGLATINLTATGEISTIGNIVNGSTARPDFFGTDPTGASTTTLNVSVEDLSGGKPKAARDAFGTASPAAKAAGATAALAQVDLNLGHFDGIGSGLAGLEDIAINQNGEMGDVFMIVDAGPGIDGDADGHSIDVVDGAGELTVFFESGTLDNGAGARVDGGDGYDILGTDVDGINSATYEVTNVELLKILEAAGNTNGTLPDIPVYGSTGTINLGGFDGTLDEVLLADGVDGDLQIINIPLRDEAILDLATICEQETLGDILAGAGVIINIDQKCAPSGALPNDFDLRLDSAGSNGRVDVIFNIESDTSTPTGAIVDELDVNDIQVLHLRAVCEGLLVVDIDDADVPDSLETLILTDDGTGASNHMQILDEDGGNGMTGFGPGSTSALTLVNGVTGTMNQRLFNIAPMATGLMFLPVLEEWTPDTFTPNPFNVGHFNFFDAKTDIADIVDPVQVNIDGAYFRMGSGNDWVMGNANAGGTPLTGLGADAMELGFGNDLAFGFAGEDSMEGGSGSDELQGGDDNDTLFGDDRFDTALVDGNNTIDGTGFGDDLLLGDAGNDLIIGGAGDDIMFGGSGRDYMVGGSGADVLCGDDDSDALFGGTQNDLLIGGSDNTFDLINYEGDILSAGTGIDFLIGDSTCEPQCFTVSFFAQDDIIGDGDEYEVTFNGVTASYTTTAGDTIADVAAALAATNFGADVTVEVDEGDILDLYDDTLIIKNFDATNAPLAAPVATATDGPAFDVVGTPADIDLTVGGLPGVDDVYSFTVAWDGGSRTYTYTVQSTDWTDGGDEDTFAEIAPTATVIRDALLAGGAGDPLPAGVTVAADGAAGINVTSAPSTTNEIGELTVTASATDGARVDEPHTLVDAVTNGDATIEDGDIYRIDFDGDATYDYEFTVDGQATQDALFDAIAADIAANSSFHVNQGGNFLVESLTGADVLRFATEDGTNPGIEFQAQNFPGGLDQAGIDIDSGVPGGGEIDPGQTFEIIVANDGAADGAGTDVTFTYTSVFGDTDQSVAAALEALVDGAVDDGTMEAAGFVGYTTRYPSEIPPSNNATAFDIVGITPGVEDLQVAVSKVAGTINQEIRTIDFDGFGPDEELVVNINPNDAAGAVNDITQEFRIPFNTSVEQTLMDLGDAIGLFIASEFPGTPYEFTVDATAQSITFAITGDGVAGPNFISSVFGADIDVIGPLGDGGTGTDLQQAFDGDAGVLDPNDTIVATNFAPLATGTDDQDFKESARDVSEQDDTQSLTPEGPTTDGADSEDRSNDASVSYDNADQFLFAGADLFITQGVDMTEGSANFEAFRLDGFDNDDLPYDFRGILNGFSGENPDIVPGTQLVNGTIGLEGNGDGGVENVTYVGDWNSGEGDKLMFENVAGQSFGPAGDVINYQEFENVAQTRDDADAFAASQFENKPNLAYVVIANDATPGGSTVADGLVNTEVDFLRVYYNEAGTGQAPEAVFELVGYNNRADITFTDIIGEAEAAAWNVDGIQNGAGSSTPFWDEVA